MSHKKFSQIYDEFMNFVDYNSWYKFLKSFLKNKNNLKVADLGCGSGKMSYLFAKDGNEVLAMDISEDMLEIAKNNYKDTNIKFLKGDITRDKIGENFDLIMCNFDTVNYFSSLSDLKSFLENSYESLKKGGYLIFDFVEEEIFDEIFENDIFIDETDNYTCIMRHEKIRKFKHLVEIVIFAKEEEVYNKYVEKHEKIIYETEKLLEMVRSIGFNIYDSARNSEYGDSRIFLVCKK